MSEVRSVADRLLANEPRIDVLINNAGVLFPERGVTSEGIEQTLAVNLLGHFLLTNLLIPRLVESAPARIINVASGGMYTDCTPFIPIRVSSVHRVAFRTNASIM